MSEHDNRIKDFLHNVLKFEGADLSYIRVQLAPVIANSEKQIREANLSPVEKITAVVQFRDLRRKRIEDELANSHSPSKKMLLQNVLKILAEPVPEKR
jgi:hypothetical protein